MASPIFLVFLVLLHRPDIVGLEQLLEVVILLLGTNLGKLGVNGIVVGGSLDIADDTEGDGEAVAITHQGELQLQGVVLAVGIMYKYVIQRVAVLADFYDLQTEALLYESEFVVLTEYELLAMLHVDGVLLTTFLVIDSLMTAIVEDDTVLQNLTY